MFKCGYYFSKILCKLKRNYEPINRYYRKKGAIIGENCLICTNLLKFETFLIEIGNNSTISTDVNFVTHDFSIHLVIPEVSDLFGKIKIGNNCFVGSNAVLMYGIELGDNVIVAAGSVVTKSFLTPNIIIGGNPAKVIGTWESFKEKNIDKAVRLKKKELIKKLKHDDSFLVER